MRLLRGWALGSMMMMRGFWIEFVLIEKEGVGGLCVCGLAVTVEVVWGKKIHMRWVFYSLASELTGALVYSDTTYMHTSTPPLITFPISQLYFVTFLTALSIKTLSYC
jgi:hypothetical protein